MATTLHLRPSSSSTSGARDDVRTASDSDTEHGTALYIAQMTGELAALARGSDLRVLAHFLDMARLEATSITRQTHPVR